MPTFLAAARSPSHDPVAALRGLLRAAGGPVVVVWDGGGPHKGEPIRELGRRWAGELCLERLPAYGWELMPVEQLWAWPGPGGVRTWWTASSTGPASLGHSR